MHAMRSDGRATQGVLVALAAAVLLAGCVSSGGLVSQAHPVTPAAVGLAAADAVDAAAPAPAPDWWRALGAPQLDALVQRRLQADLLARSIDSQVVLVHALGGGYVGEPARSAQRDTPSWDPQGLAVAPTPVVHN